MRILLANHTGAWSGAEVSLMRLVEGLSEGHELAVACPPEGRLPEALERAEIERLDLPAVRVSTRLHVLETPAGLRQLSASGLALGRAIRRFRPDVVHANTLRAGLMAAVARKLGSPPVVVRSHDRLVPGRLGRSVRSTVIRNAAAVAAVSDYAAASFNEGLRRPVAVRVYNSIDHARFDPASVRPARVRQELGLHPNAPLLGQVAQITSWKGQDTAIRALSRIRGRGLDAHLLLVGHIAFSGKGVRLDNVGYVGELEELVDELGLRGAVHFLGLREDVPEILAALDLSLLPSWGEPFGLATVESMAMGTPPLVSAIGAGPELVEEGMTGRLLPPGEPGAWAEAIGELLSDRAGLERMGARAIAAAARFRDDVHAQQMLALYERAAGRPERRPSVEDDAPPAETVRAS
jgi:glycosyltransferase involved in cell wall biosynthesis